MRAKRKPLKLSLTEKQVTAQVVDAAKALGIDLNRQNTGGFTNPSGRYVQFGQAGNSDFIGVLPDGRALMVELKREDFDPRTVRGKDKVRFDRQLERLRETNAKGGIGMWVRSGPDFLEAMRRVLDGWKVIIDDDGFCFVTDESSPA